MATEWQWHYLLRDYQDPAADSGTLRLKLPVREQISCIEIEARMTVAQAHWNQSIIDVLRKIEVIANGATILYSCFPETAAFLHYTQIRSIPNMERKDVAAAPDKFVAKICFGRYQRDPEYMLDTAQYNNVYLEIPWDGNNQYWTDDTMYWTIRYLRPIQKLSPVGFIRSRDIEYSTYTWTGAGFEYIDLPLKYPWYMLGCRYWDVDRDMFADLDKIKLDIDDGRLVLVEEDTDDILTTNTERLPYPVHVTQKHVGNCPTTNVQVRTYLGSLDEISVEGYQNIPVNVGISPVSGQRTVFNVGGSPGTGAPIAAPLQASFWGAAYMCCLVIKDWWKTWFDPEPQNPFPVGEHSEAQLIYHHANAVTVTTDLSTFLQEVCPIKI